MKWFITASVFLFAVSASTLSHSAPETFTKKKCKDGYVWDKEKKKCVKEERGSTRGSY